MTCTNTKSSDSCEAVEGAASPWRRIGLWLEKGIIRWEIPQRLWAPTMLFEVTNEGARTKSF